MNWLHRLGVLGLLLSMVLGGGEAAAQAGPLRIIYVFGAGGSGDVASRMLAEHMQKTLGITVIVENKVGAGGRIAIEYVKAAVPDGNTVLVTSMGPMAVLPHTLGNLRYDPFKDFLPVAHMVDSPIALTVGPGVKARDAREYVALVRSSPKAGFFAVAPSGGLPHFLGLHFAAINGVEMNAIGYKGGAQMVLALMGGEVPASYSTPNDMIPLHKAGKLRIVAVSGAGRMRIIPEVPTFRESGYDIEASTWFGMFAPAATPAAAVSRISQAVAAAIGDPAIRNRLLEMGFEPTGSGPAELGAAMRRDHDRWAPVIKASGYRVTD